MRYYNLPLVYVIPYRCNQKIHVIDIAHLRNHTLQEAPRLRRKNVSGCNFQTFRQIYRVLGTAIPRAGMTTRNFAGAKEKQKS